MKYADVNALLCELGQDVIIKDPTTGQERADIVIRTADLCGDKVPSPWISVKERLPEDFDTKVVWTDRGILYLATFTGMRWYTSGGEYIRDEEVTHWMQLPDLPEVEERKEKER